MPKICPAVKAVIKNNGKILVLRKRRKKIFPSDIDLPGGRINFGEHDAKNALLREVKEETGLDVEIMQPLDIATIVRIASLQIVATMFLCRAESADVKLSKEHRSYEWLPANEIIRNKKFPKWIKDSVRLIA